MCSNLITFCLITCCLTTMIKCRQSTPDESPTVATTSGRLTGLTVKQYRSHVHQYLGVPYARPPINERRFQLPVQIESGLDKELETKTSAPTCMQFKHHREAISELLNVDDKHTISEDCLYLNVYVPVVNASTAKLPVMVWIPGEGFDFADARQFDGSYLASTGNVIVVTVQYRVGVFGFLKYKNIAPGNMGLWDQVTALRWIKQNIAQFGGDAERVTVFGRFTGSMSISLLLTSPELITENLYKRAILMSGIAIDSYIFESDPESKADELIRYLDCETNVEECLLRGLASNILFYSGYEWKPTVDNKLITEEPISALRRGQFSHSVSDILLGKNTNEGTICLLPHLIMKNDYYKRFLNDEMNADDYFRLTKSDIRMFVGSEEAFKRNFIFYKQFIMNIFNEKTNQTIEEKYLKFCSTLLINEPIRQFTNALSNEAWVSTFIYELKYRPSLSNVFPRSNVFTGSVHGDDVLLIFAPSNSTAHITDADLNVSKTLIRSFAAFAADGAIEREQSTKQTNTLSVTQMTMKRKLSVRLSNMLKLNATQLTPTTQQTCSNNRRSDKLFTLVNLNLNHVFSS